MTRPRRGKAALFSQAPGTVDEGDDDTGRAAGPSAARRGAPRRAASPAAPTGRQQILDSGTGGRSWTVSCRSCRAETPITGTDLARRVLRPGSIWWPLARHAHRMPCPACGDTSWCRIRWRRARPGR